MQPVTLGLVQMRCVEEPSANLSTAQRMIREAAGRGAQVICLPELFLTRYFCQTEDAAPFQKAERVPGPTTEALEPLAAELGVALLVPLFEKRAEGLYHNAVAVLDGARGYVGKYRKMHIPDDPSFYEKFYFTPGDLGFKAFDTQHARVGTLICWDQWYPEAARLTALQGAAVLFYPTAIGWLPAERDEHGAAQHDAWELTQRAHAVSNGCFVAAANRVGFEPAPEGAPGSGITFWGQSFIAGPDGQIIARAPADEEAVLVEEIDLARLDATRTEWPFFRDRRIDAYAGLTRRFLDDDG